MPGALAKPAASALQAPRVEPPPKCKWGEVALADRSCKLIDRAVIESIASTVGAKKAELDALQKKYDAVHKPDCISCPGSADFALLRAELIEAHKEYSGAMMFLSNALSAWDNLMQKGGSGSGSDTASTIRNGPEFVLGTKKLRPHCEPWTVNRSQVPDDNMCGVVCRSQPSCIGFARDPKNSWCVWFDEAEQHPEDACSSQTETQYVQSWKKPLNETLWVAIQKLHIFDSALVNGLKVADSASDNTVHLFQDWLVSAGLNQTQRGRKEFKDSFDSYTKTVDDMLQIRKQYLILQRAALDLSSSEAMLRPPLPAKASITPVPATNSVTAPQNLVRPASKRPKPLRWEDFPNSQDTAWSKLHPDCPMGPPCFCDCKCRGAPPQNFVEAPQAPPIPCPPPRALPNPFMLTPAGSR
jgi:hypothetical protein